MLRALYNREMKFDNNFSYVGLRYMNVYGQRQYEPPRCRGRNPHA